MNITFLIGNGFDIGMGIASSYKTVEAHYAGLEKKSPILQAFQKSLEENGEYWSNFERGIGKYTDTFPEDKQADFQLCLDDFSDELIQYLYEEESKIDYNLCNEEIQKEFVRSISEFDADIPEKYRNIIRAIITKNGGVDFRFISFNYTHILDECLKRSFNNDTAVGKHKMNGTHYSHLVKTEVFHIHGALPGPIIMGVDNASQISNKKRAEQRRFQQKLAKPSMNARAGSLIDEKVSRLIEESNIICVFGMSLGATDKTWWKQIGSWLYGADRVLVLFGHEDNDSSIKFSHQRQFDKQNKLIDTFLDLAEISGGNREVLERKIISTINPTLFNINLVELTEQKRETDAIEQNSKIKQLEAEYEKYQKMSELTTVT